MGFLCCLKSLFPVRGLGLDQLLIGLDAALVVRIIRRQIDGLLMTLRLDFVTDKMVISSFVVQPISLTHFRCHLSSILCERSYLMSLGHIHTHTHTHRERERERERGFIFRHCSTKFLIP